MRGEKGRLRRRIGNQTVKKRRQENVERRKGKEGKEEKRMWKEGKGRQGRRKWIRKKCKDEGREEWRTEAEKEDGKALLVKVKEEKKLIGKQENKERQEEKQEKEVWRVDTQNSDREIQMENKKGGKIEKIGKAVQSGWRWATDGNEGYEGREGGTEKGKMQGKQRQGKPKGG